MRVAIACLLLATGAANAAGNIDAKAWDDARDFDYFANNWNVVGLKDYQFGARVTPDNRILLGGRAAGDATRYDRSVQVKFGRSLAPLSRTQGKRAHDGWMPVIEIAASEGPVRYAFTYWATPLPTVQDWRKAFDWPAEGENFAVWVRCTATNTSDAPAEAKAEVVPSAGAVAGPPLLARTLGPGEAATETARFAFQPAGPGVDAALAQADAEVWLQRTIAWWGDLEKSVAVIRVPDRKANDTLLAAHVCQMIANDHGEVRGGEGFYDQFYIRDGAYQIMELEEAGLWDAARKSIELYLPRQRPDGRFESQTGQFDANGQAVWALWQYYRITADRAWLERVYPAMRKAVEWTTKTRRLAPADSPYAGLLPAADADGEFIRDPKNFRHIVGYDFWNLRGMLCAADAARRLGKADEAAVMEKEAALYRQDMDAAWKRTGLAYFPPSWENEGTFWGSTETLWPTPLFAHDDARVAAGVNHVRHEFGGGFIEGSIQWRGQGPGVIHPYLTAYTTMTDLICGHDEQVVEDFYWYLLHSTAAHAFPEGVYYKRRYAWGETIPHVTGACNYSIMLRHLLVHEQGEELRLLSAVPDGWLEEGREIRVERLPTWFGELNLTVRGKREGVEVTFDPPRREQPKRIVLTLPASRRLLNKVPGVEVVSRAPQRQRWDFPAVVARYEEGNPTAITRKPDAVSLTTAKPATCSSSLPGHAAALANDGFSRDPDGYWATDVAHLNDPNPWWQVDLEKPATIGRVVVVGYYGDRRSYGFTVEASLDGKSWEMLADRHENTAPSTRDGYACTFEPRPARYLRVTQTANTANTGRHLVEVMAYEK